MDDFAIRGKWFNKITGQVIHVRDSIIDGDNMIVVSDIGNINMNEFSDNYIQMSDDIYDESGHIIDNNKADISQINVDNRRVTPDMISQTTEITDYRDTRKDIKETKQIERNIIDKSTIKQYNKTENKTEETNSEKLLRKLFEKKQFNSNNIKLNINIESENFPTQELNMLKMIYDVSDTDIATYIKDHIITDEFVILAIKQFISDNKLFSE